MIRNLTIHYHKSMIIFNICGSPPTPHAHSLLWVCRQRPFQLAGNGRRSHSTIIKIATITGECGGTEERHQLGWCFVDPLFSM